MEKDKLTKTQEIKTEEFRTEELNLKSYWDGFLKEEFMKETDRGAVILASTLLESRVVDLLRSFFLPDANSNDDLFEGSNAPLSSFYAKISMCYRVGLISKRFTRDLHLIRKIRNEFAHNIHGCSFEHSTVISRVSELYKSSKVCNDKKLRTTFPPNNRGNFLMVASWMLWSLNSKFTNVDPIDECEKEFGYYDPEEFKKSEDEN